ncbi:ABC transporter substrate-binding protein [bacterium]|nr:MAG: ABC transporter substrate-binding protein [bacterium]
MYRSFAALLGVLAVAATLGASSPGAAAGGSLKHLLPSSIAQAGVLHVASDISYAPVEFYAPGTHDVKGLDYDIATAMGKKLGVRFDFINTTFDGIIPALLSHRFDIVFSAMNDTPEREKRIDFIDYFLAGSGVLVRKGNPEHVASLADLCGKTADAEQGTAQVTFLQEQSKRCVAEHKKAINVLAFATDTDALEQLKLGRSSAHVADYPVASYDARMEGGGRLFEVAGKQFAVAAYGIGVRKEDRQLRDALQAALKAVIADGEYDRILTKWGLEEGALRTAPISAGGRYH